MFELLVLAALKHEEISEGRAHELLGWTRKRIREQQINRIGELDYKTKEEVWAEEGGIRLRFSEQDSNLVVEILDVTDGCWLAPSRVQATATITDWRTCRLMAVMRQVTQAWETKRNGKEETENGVGRHDGGSHDGRGHHAVETMRGPNQQRLE